MSSQLASQLGAFMLAGLLILVSVPVMGAQGVDGPASGMSSDLAAQHFIQEMIPHHEDAIIMADLALVQAEHPEVRELATTIKRVQAEEIALMRQWYRDWYGIDPPASTMGRMGHGMGGHEQASIDGAVPFDRAFIEEMVPHHEMAVMMSTMALRHVDRPELRELLRSIIDGQSAEVAQMRSWYEAWYGSHLLSMVGLPGPGSLENQGAPMHMGHGAIMGQGRQMGDGRHAMTEDGAWGHHSLRD
jgi:uncharacterized protein (DUF305 family)